MKIEKVDYRKMPESARYEIRKRVVVLVCSKKMTRLEASESFGVNNCAVGEWVKRYKLGGYKALLCGKKGRKSEDMKLLSNDNEKFIQKLMIDKHPDQYKLNFALWTRKAVQELIEQELCIILAITTVGDYLKKWGFTPQKPAKRAYEQCPKKVQEFLDNEYPKIKEDAKLEKADIYWGDETGVKNTCNHGRGYAPKGKTPIKVSLSKRLSINMVSAITNRGDVQFMLYSDTMNAVRLIEFMQLLIKNAKRKVFLILDNLKVHHCKVVKNWLLENSDKIKVFHLPSYSPELNPDEYLNCDLKQGLSVKRSPRNEKQLTENVENHMNMLQNNPQRIEKYFKHKSIKYAS